VTRADAKPITDPQRPSNCGACGFDLTGGAGDTCPECGVDIWVAQYSLEKWPTGWLMASIIGAIVLGGASIFLPDCDQKMATSTRTFVGGVGLLLGLAHASWLFGSAMCIPKHARTSRLIVVSWLAPLVSLSDLVIVYFVAVWVSCT